MNKETKTRRKRKKVGLETIIMKNIIEKCQFCSSSKVERGKQIVIDRYYSIKDIERVLNDFFNQ